MRSNRLLHWLDRYLGIPLIFILGKCKKKHRLFSCPPEARIAFLNTAAIGDTVLMSGVIADIKEHFPQAQCTFFVGSSNHDAALLIPGVDVVQLPVMSPFRSFAKIREYRFDLWIDFGSWTRINALYSYVAHAEFKIGFKTPHQYRHFVYDQAVNHQKIHELENYRNLVASVGVHSTHFPLLKREGKKQPSKQLVLHLFSGGSQGRFKQWPKERWISLIDQLVEKGYAIYLTGNRGDRKGCEEVKAACRSPEKIIVQAGQLSLREVALLLESSQAVISVDTGIMHLAAALGCLTIALHGPTAPERWGGKGPRVISIIPTQWYVPWIHLGFEKGKGRPLQCMHHIEVKQVLQALE